MTAESAAYSGDFVSFGNYEGRILAPDTQFLVDCVEDAGDEIHGMWSRDLRHEGAAA